MPQPWGAFYPMFNSHKSEFMAKEFMAMAPLLDAFVVRGDHLASVCSSFLHDFGPGRPSRFTGAKMFLPGVDAFPALKYCPQILFTALDSLCIRREQGYSGKWTQISSRMWCGICL